MRDPSKFLQTFESWKNGNSYWDARGIQIPQYEDGKDNYRYVYSGTKHIDPSPNGERIAYEITAPDTVVTADYPYYSSNNPNYKSSFDPNGAENFLDATGVGTIYNPFRYTREISNFQNDPKQAAVGALEASIPFSAPARIAYGAYQLANKNGIQKTANLISNKEYGGAALSGAGDILNAAMASPIATRAYSIAKNLTPEMRRLNLYITKAPFSYDGAGTALKTYTKNILTKNKSQMLLESKYPDWDKTVDWKYVGDSYGGIDADVVRKARIDAYRLYNLMPQKYDTFVKSPSYLNTYTAKRDVDNLTTFPIPLFYGNDTSVIKYDNPGLMRDFVNSSGGIMGYDISNVNHTTSPEARIGKTFGLMTTKDRWDLNPFEMGGILNSFPQLSKPFILYNNLKRDVSTGFRKAGDYLYINAKAYRNYLDKYKSRFGQAQLDEDYDLDLLPSQYDFPNKGLKLKIGQQLQKLAYKTEPKTRYDEGKLYKKINDRFAKFEVGDFTTSKPFDVVNEIPFTHYYLLNDGKAPEHSMSKFQKIIKGIDENGILPTKVLDMVKNKNLSTNMNIKPPSYSDLMQNQKMDWKDGKDVLPGYANGTNGPKILSEQAIYNGLKRYGISNPYVAAALTANAGIESEYNSDSAQASGAHRGLWQLQPKYVQYVTKHYGGYGPEEQMRFAADVANGTLPETKSTVGKWLNTGVSQKFRSTQYKNAADASTGWQRYFEGAMGQKDIARRTVAERIYKQYKWDDDMNALNKMIQSPSIQQVDNTRVAMPAINNQIPRVNTPQQPMIMQQPTQMQSMYPNVKQQQPRIPIMQLPPITQTLYNLYNDQPMLNIPQVPGFARGKDKGIHIAKSKEGTFTRAANKHKMGVQEFANKVLSAPKGKYSSVMRKKANFAKQSAKWNH